MSRRRKYASLITGIVAAVIYGVITRFVFGRNSSAIGSLSVSFFLFVPPALGFMTVHLATPEQKRSWAYMIFAPWLSCLACVIVAGLFALEAWFCIILALPLFLCLASIGGIIAGLIWRVGERRNNKNITTSALLVFMILPHMFVPIEQTFPLQKAIRTVHSQIEISAPPEVIWQNITNLRRIKPSEERPALFHLVGLPRPLEAEMSCERVGCTRYGLWENGLAFEGVITRIVPNRLYWLNLTADVSHVRPSMAPLSQIGEQVFGMVDDGYEIEYLGNNHSMLHLYSTYRLTTRINTYGTLWIDLLLRDIQHYILTIEKTRCEAQSPK